jgi:alkylmercury lyase
MVFSTMGLSFEEIKQAWQQRHPETSAEQYRFTDTLLRMLSEGQPVSAERYATEVDLPIEKIREGFRQAQANGAEFDDEGNLIGDALTLKPTRHNFNVEGKALFAWCSLDTLFLPGLIGKTAYVESTDPITGEMISLTITPEGVNHLTPETAVASIVVPGMTAHCENCTPNQSGPESVACSQMHYFASYESAEKWIQNHSDVAILTVHEAFELSTAVWLEPRQRMTENTSFNNNHEAQSEKER